MIRQSGQASPDRMFRSLSMKKKEEGVPYLFTITIHSMRYSAALPRSAQQHPFTHAGYLPAMPVCGGM